MRPGCGLLFDILLGASVVLDHAELHVELRHTVDEEVFQTVADVRVSVMPPHERLVGHVLARDAVIEPFLIYASDSLRQRVGEPVALHEVHEIRLYEENLLLGELRLYERHAPLCEVAVRYESRFL